MSMESRVTRIHVIKEGEAIFNEYDFVVEIDDEAAGEFVVVSQNGRDGPGISIDPGEWPELRKAINQMVRSCRA